MMAALLLTDLLFALSSQTHYFLIHFELLQGLKRSLSLPPVVKPKRCNVTRGKLKKSPIVEKLSKSSVNQTKPNHSVQSGGVSGPI